MNNNPIDAIKGIMPSKGGNKAQGAFVAENQDNKKKFSEMIAAAYNGASGHVSPPANNVMGFGPASEA